MSLETTDVVVIGSGYGGAVPAARFAQAGLNVVILERGPRMTNADFRQTEELEYINSILDLLVSSENIMYRTGSIVGGASIAMDCAHFRMPARSFEETDPTGRRYWPGWYTRASLDPYYDRADAGIGVRQFGWDEIPKGGGLFAKMLDSAGASCDRARMNLRDCVGCGHCSQGCIFGKKNSMIRTYLPLAEANGAEIRPGCDVTSIEPDGTGFIANYMEGGEAKCIRGDRMFVACGGIHTAALLLRSPALTALTHEHVGQHFNTNGEMQYLAILPPEFDDLSTYFCYKGPDNGAVMSYHWFESDSFTIHPSGGLEPSALAAALEATDHPIVPRRSWGMEYKRFIEAVYPHRVFGFSSLGLSPGHGAITLRSDGSADVVADEDVSGTHAFLDRMEAALQGVAAASGVTILPAYGREFFGTTAAHLLSACRMSEAPADGVVDPEGRVWGYENLYITDASALPYSLGVNPALSITAYAERVVEQAIARG